jgi:hypothetical protein
MSSAVDLWNVSDELLGAEILDNLNSVINILKEQLPLMFIPIKIKEILTEKHCEGLYLIRV